MNSNSNLAHYHWKYILPKNGWVPVVYFAIEVMSSSVKPLLKSNGGFAKLGLSFLVQWTTDTLSGLDQIC